MRRLFVRIFLIGLFYATGAFSAYPAVPAAPLSVTQRYGKHISRTLDLLSRKQRVKVCFFGQSLCDDGQSWTHAMNAFFKASFPGAQIDSVNKAVAGKSSDFLYPYVEPQLSGVNPDLLIFHDYSNSDSSYEQLLKKIIATVPATCEILVFNDHVHNTPAQQWHDDWSLVRLPAMCEKYGVGFNDTRTMWKLYLQANYGDPYKWQVTSPINDGTHFNAQGQWLQTELMKPYFLRTTPTHSKVSQRKSFLSITPKQFYSIDGRLVNRKNVMRTGVLIDRRGNGASCMPLLLNQ